jgi:hypothetical protein
MCGVKAGQRILEDHRHFGAADLAQFRLRGLQHVGAVEQDLPVALSRSGQQPHGGEGGLALARAAFANDAKALAGCHLKGDSRDSVYGAVSVSKSTARSSTVRIVMPYG